MDAPLENPYQVEDGDDPGEDGELSPSPAGRHDTEPQDEQPEEERVPAERIVVKPIYDFRRVYRRLPDMATRDPATTKRLLLMALSDRGLSQHPSALQYAARSHSIGS